MAEEVVMVKHVEVKYFDGQDCRVAVSPNLRNIGTSQERARLLKSCQVFHIRLDNRHPKQSLRGMNNIIYTGEKHAH